VAKIAMIEMFRREVIERKVCSLWPDCSCYHTLVQWQRNLRDEDKVWELEILEGGQR